MNPIALIGLVLSIIRMLPKLLSVGMEIAKLIPQFKNGGIENDLKVVWEILKLIGSLITSGDKSMAQVSMIELRNRLRMGDKEGLLRQRDSLKHRRSVMQGVPEPVEKV